MKEDIRVGDWIVQPYQNRLVRGEQRVKIDPKAMQVLLCLAERAPEVANKESIIETVWEGTFVTDEVLTNAIWELRKVLGDDAKAPEYIQTVPRKGYRLIANLKKGRISSAEALPTFLQEDERTSAERPVFVAREEELGKLGRFLEAVLGGQGRVVFVTGEAGAGKTALVSEFARFAQKTHAELVVAGGNCNAHTGVGDPYLPFRRFARC